MKPADVKPSTYIEYSKEINYQDPRCEIGEYQNIKRFLQKAMFQIFVKKFSWLNKVRNVDICYQWY